MRPWVVALFAVALSVSSPSAQTNSAKTLDTYVIDGFIWLVGFVPQLFGFTLKLTTQRGSLQGYAAAMLLAVVLILLVLFL
jgi:hypothetical protein